MYSRIHALYKSSGSEVKELVISRIQIVYIIDTIKMPLTKYTIFASIFLTH